MAHCSAGSGLAVWLSVGVLAGLGAGPCAAATLHGHPEPVPTYGLRCMNYTRAGLGDHLTAIISTSPRKEDATGEGLDVLNKTVQSIFQTLGPLRVIVAFDALPDQARAPGVEDLPGSVAHDYAEKLKGFEALGADVLGGPVTVFKNSEWTHQAEMVHRVLEHLQEEGTLTPFVYLAQDDSPVFGDIDVPWILRMLSCDPDVRNVRLLKHPTCVEREFDEPCTQHPATPFLHKMKRYSDRPNFGTTAFFLNEMFPRIPRSYRGGPERNFNYYPHLWLYGEEGRMWHERNALVDSYNEWSGIKPGNKR